MKLSLAMPPGPRSVELALLASELGYERIWLYDSAAVYEDVWIWLARIAEHSEMDFGAAVLVPSLRHVMTTASAIATIERSAPGRLAVALGTGASACWVLGQRPLSWQHTRSYAEQLYGLLHGEVVVIDGQRCQMIHHPDWAQIRPINTPILLSASGPAGTKIAEELHAEGIIEGIIIGQTARGISWRVMPVFGTVLESGETLRDERVKQALGPRYTIEFHHLMQFMPQLLADLPAGAEWRSKVEEERPQGDYHLAVHQGHATDLSPRDHILVDAAGDDLGKLAWAGTREEIRAKVDREARGVSELMYAPVGPDMPREMRLFADAVLH